MSYNSLEACLADLEKHHHLVRVKEMVDPELEMAAIHLKVHEAGGPALLFENVKGCRYRAASNIFGTIERSRFIFRDTLASVEKVIALKNNPVKAIKKPLSHFGVLKPLLHALPLKRAAASAPVLKSSIQISDLPQIRHWPKDGGAFITLPQVFSEDPYRKGIMHSNLGMYRIQISGGEYIQDQEVGLHYQIHRGIGVHQYKAMQKGESLKVSVFVGGPPAHTLAAVMPLPEGLSELSFAGMLGGRRFRYLYQDGYCISTEADFVICGEVVSGSLKPEGPFGDHLGYYSLAHDFPVLRVKKVFARDRAIWPFTVVGRPPQEDTAFGMLIHELTGDAIPAEIPGVKEIHAVDAAGVHPLLLAIGQERYTPYAAPSRPAELLTIANHLLGTGQLSLAKYLFIVPDDPHRKVSTHDIADYFSYLLERVVWEKDLHFQTETTIDTLDYTSGKFNQGSKLVIAACGEAKRKLATEIPSVLYELGNWHKPLLCLPGIVVLQGEKYTAPVAAEEEVQALIKQLEESHAVLDGVPLILLADDSGFTAASLNNFLWVTFTRSNPAQDVYGVHSFTVYKHWGCKGPLIIDARIKPHHAPLLELDPEVLKRTERFFNKGGSLHGILP